MRWVNTRENIETNRAHLASNFSLKEINKKNKYQDFRRWKIILNNFEVECLKDFYFSLEEDMELLYKTPSFYVYLCAKGRNETHNHNKLIFHKIKHTVSWFLKQAPLEYMHFSRIFIMKIKNDFQN